MSIIISVQTSWYVLDLTRYLLKQGSLTMYTTYKAHTTIEASTKAVWNAITRQSFIKEFLPEVKNSIRPKGEYTLSTYCHASLVLPSYADHGQVIGWVSGPSNTIRLSRKDIEANIEVVEIQLEADGSSTKVTILVAYNPKLGKNFFRTHRCVRGLFNIKLDVLKKYFETNFKEVDWVPAFA